MQRHVALVVLCLFVVRGGSCQEKRATELARAADRALHEGEYALAISQYQVLLRLEPLNSAAWSNLGSAWFAQSNFAQASASYLHATRLEPANADYAYNAALSLVREDKCKVAEPSLKFATKSTGHRASSEFLEGLCAFVAKDWQESKAMLLKAEEGGNRTAETYYMLAVASRRSSDPAQAKRAFDTLRATFPDSSLLHELVGDASDDLFLSADAEKEISLAIVESPLAPTLHAKLGYLMWKEHRLSEAEESFKEELRIDPHSYSALHFLGEICEQRGDLTAALLRYEQAVVELPGSGEAHFSVGRVLELQGHSAAALQELEKSFPALQGNVPAHYWTARVLRRLGLKERAALEMVEVQKLNKAERDGLMTKLVQP